jgi:DNA-binding XRE family transcriptional regulator
MPRALDFSYHMTHQEIADVMGVSRQTIRTIEIKALKKLINDPKMKGYYDALESEYQICGDFPAGSDSIWDSWSG